MKLLIVAIGLLAQAPRAKPQQWTFTPQEVETERLDPGGSYHIAPAKHHFESLLKVRTSFAPELAKSVDNVR